MSQTLNPKNLSNFDHAYTRRGLTRLLQLADFLTFVPRENFNMAVVVAGTYDPDLGCHTNTPESAKSPAHCGTCACAAGWAGYRFPHSLTYEKDVWGGLNLTNKKTGSDGVRAVCEFFDLPYSDLDYDRVDGWLFGDCHDRTPKQEAGIIRTFVRHAARHAGFDFNELETKALATTPDRFRRPVKIKACPVTA